MVGYFGSIFGVWSGRGSLCSSPIFEDFRLGGFPCGGGKHGSIWQNCVSNPVLKGFLTLYLIKTLYKMLAGLEDHLANFSFPGVSQIMVKSSTWGQCPQVLAGTAGKVAKSTRLCSYAGFPCPLYLEGKGNSQASLVLQGNALCALTSQSSGSTGTSVEANSLC